MLIVERADPLAPGPKALLEASHALMREMFEPEENYFLDFEALRGDVQRVDELIVGQLKSGALKMPIARLADFSDLPALHTAFEARELIGRTLIRLD